MSRFPNIRICSGVCRSIWNFMNLKSDLQTKLNASFMLWSKPCMFLWNFRKNQVFWSILEIFFIFAFFFAGSRWARSTALDTLRTVFNNVLSRAAGSFSACRPTLVRKRTFNCRFKKFSKKITGFLTNTNDMVFAPVRGRSSTPAAVLQGCRWPQHRRPAWKVLNWSTRAPKNIMLQLNITKLVKMLELTCHCGLHRNHRLFVRVLQAAKHRTKCHDIECACIP